MVFPIFDSRRVVLMRLPVSIFRLVLALIGMVVVLWMPLPAKAGAPLIALTESLPPLNYEVDGKVTGFASELLDMMAGEADLPVQKQLLPWGRAYEMVARQKNTLIYCLVRTPEREALFQWVGPISSRRIVLYKHRDRTDISLKSLDDARAYRIGTTLESAATKSLIQQGFVVNGPQQPLGPGLDIALHDQMNLNKFMAKRFDLLVSLDWAAAYNAKNAGLAPDALQPAWVLDDSLTYWYGVSLQTDPEVVKKLNAALQKIKNDGRYQQLRQKYLPKIGK